MEREIFWVPNRRNLCLAVILFFIGLVGVVYGVIHDYSGPLDFSKFGNGRLSMLSPVYGMVFLIFAMCIVGAIRTLTRDAIVWKQGDRVFVNVAGLFGKERSVCASDFRTQIIPRIWFTSPSSYPFKSRTPIIVEFWGTDPKPIAGLPRCLIREMSADPNSRKKEGSQ